MTRGLTLIEVLIAMSITAIMGAMVAGAISQVDHAAVVTRGQAERYGEARRALSRLSGELAMAFVSEHFDAARFTNGRPTLFRGREDGVLFTTMSHVRLFRGARESDQAVVEYSLDRDPEDRDAEALVRREKLRVDGDPESGGRRDVVARGVKRLTLSYWDAKKKEWVRDWDTSRVERANDLPAVVRAEMELTLADGRTERLSSAARVAIPRPLDF
ncbi:MAG TPA: type II secretion system protein GspJ [Anaeromyxobacteraceae bacterium]|nr:type II secretion system protein GspJ [Anaeromyxobacteraceae bacterium]